jgi:CheY-like chemotaxis protein
MEKSNSQTLLIAEDDEVNFYLLKNILSKEYNIIHAKNGEESIWLLKENPAISLILMDIKMPGEFDGLEATKKIREFNTEIPIIAQTAYAQNSDKIEALEAGCNDYISKPFSAGKLRSIISKYFQ